MSRKLSKNQNGFTIIELLFATVVFSVLLLVMLMAFVRIGELFYKGVSMSKTQEDARSVVQSVADDIQFNKSPLQSLLPSSNVYCVGIHRYLFQPGTHVDGTPGNYGIERDDLGVSCPSTATACSTNCTNMLDANMQVNNFQINCSNGLCDVNIHLVFYGGSNPDQFFYSPSGSAPSGHVNRAPDAQCNGSMSDTKLCAAVDYDSTVLDNT